jgi:hypothetical protein
MNKRDRRAEVMARRYGKLDQRKQFKGRLITLDDIKAVLRAHHIGCVFELDAPQKILDQLGTKTQEEWFENGASITQFREIFISVEMYCPWEGINRLSEYGITELEWTE